MESWISSKSLITGNVSTEESRNEMRKSPGAPRPPANATIFCFHPLNFPCKTSLPLQKFHRVYQTRSHTPVFSVSSVLFPLRTLCFRFFLPLRGTTAQTPRDRSYS